MADEWGVASEEPWGVSEEAPIGGTSSGLSSIAGASAPQTSQGGAFGRAAARGVAPAAGGMVGFGLGAEAGAALGTLGGPYAPITVPVGSIAGGLIGAFGGAEAVGSAQNWALEQIPASWRKALGQDPEQVRADVEKYPITSFAGEMAPQVLFMRPGRVSTAALPANASRTAKVMANPLASRAAGAAIAGGQEAGFEVANEEPLDWSKVGIAAGAGAFLNKETAFGRRLVRTGTSPVQRATSVLTNIAQGRPASAPSLEPPQTGPVGTAAAIPPAEAPGGGDVVGLRVKNGPPRRGIVDHYFDNGNAVRLRMDDGSTFDLTTQDLMRDLTAAPAPMQERAAPPRPNEQVSQDERPVAPLADEWGVAEQAPYRPRKEPGPLGDNMIRALDQADALEARANDMSLNLTGAERQDMLAAAAQQRRIYGGQPDEGRGPGAYRHPMADEPAADLGELARARVENPELYEGDYSRQPVEQSSYTYALQDVYRSRRAPPKDITLFDAIRALGGVKPDSDLNFMLRDYRNEPFKTRVLNSEGMSPDRMRAALQEQGWFGRSEEGAPGERPGDDLQDLYDLMDREARGEKVYRPDSDAHRDIFERNLLDEELARAGVSAADNPREAARKLADFRRSEEAHDFWQQHEAAVDADLANLPPEDLERLTSHGYEPGADIGAEYEETGGPEGSLARPEDFAGEPLQNLERGEQAGSPSEGETARRPARREDVGRGVTDEGGDWGVLREEEREYTPKSQIDTPEFKRWFGDSKIVDESGQPKVMYRGDFRDVGPRFKKKATESARFYFTDDPAIAANYAEGKSYYDEDRADFEHWFSFPPPKGQRKPLNLVQLWHYLDGAQREAVKDALLRAVNGENGIEFKDRPDGGITSPSHWDYEVRNARGNWLQAGKEIWLSSGAMFGEEGRFMDILKHAGIKGEYDNPHEGRPVVTPVYLSVQNPVQAKAISREFMDRLAQEIKGDRTRSKERPMWNKEGITPKEWLADLQKEFDAKGGAAVDLSDSYAWTSVPERITAALQRMGFDGIDDRGGKGAGPGGLLAEKHHVVIAFEPEQIKSAIGNRGTFDPESPNILREDANKYAPTFYSALSRGVEGLKQTKAPSAQWKGILDNLPGVKKEELEWSGVREWLDQQKGPVTKQELEDFLRSNEVQVQEVEKGADRKRLSSEDEAEFDDLNTRYREDPDNLSQEEYERLGDLRDRIEGDNRDTSGPKYSTYVLPGGENYRELLLTLPHEQVPLVYPEPVTELPEDYHVSHDRTAEPAYRYAVIPPGQIHGRPLGGRGWESPSVATREAIRHINEERNQRAADEWRKANESGVYKSSHWDEPNILAHIRFDDRTGPNGERILHIAEVQSDWHQKGRRDGYDTPLKTEPVETGDPDNPFNGAEIITRQSGVPNAPFKTTWQELAMKRMLRYAAENGYDKLSWDTGATAAERFDLSKSISRIRVYGDGDSLTVSAWDKGDKNVMDLRPTTKDGLSDLIGKEAAEKILSKPAPKKGNSYGFRELSGLDLKVGGEGMRGFYDRILPAFMNKYAKKWGAKVGQEKISTGEGGERYRVELGPDDGSYRVIGPNGVEDTFFSRNDALRLSDKLNLRDQRGANATVHSVEITPAMRESVMQGQAMFESKRGSKVPQDAAIQPRPQNLERTFNNWIAEQGVGRTPRGLAQSIQKFLVDRGRDTGTEALAVYDSKLGDVSHVLTDNHPRLVKLSPELLEHVGNPENSVIAHHNHPSSSSLSKGDVLLLGHHGINWIVAHGDDGSWTAMQLTQKGLDLAPKGATSGVVSFALKQAYAQAEKLLHPHLYDAVVGKKITPEEINRDYNGIINSVLDAKGYVRYLSSKEMEPHVRDTVEQAIRAASANHDYRLPKPVRYEDGIGEFLAPNGRAAGQPGSARGAREGAGVPRKPEQLKLLEEEKNYAAPARLPRNMTEAGDRLDRVSDDLADTLKGQAPGTYERTLRNMVPEGGASQFKGANVIEKNMSLFPHTLAKLDTLSGKFWNAWKDRDATQSRLMHEARDFIAPTFLKLPEQSRRRVYAAEELDRVNGNTRQDTGHSIVARNDDVGTAAFSKPGEVFALTPEETRAYFERRAMFQHQWDAIMEGTARRLGWEGAWGKDTDANLQAVKEAAAGAERRSEQRHFGRILDVLTAMAQQRRDAYVPLMRFGDYFVSVKPKVGTDMTSGGGFPETAWFELVERPAMSDWTGTRHKTGDVPSYAKARIDDLRSKYPADKFDIEHGYLFRKADVLRKLDIPAIEKLMTVMEGGVLRSLYEGERGRGLSKDEARTSSQNKYDQLYGELIEELRDQMYEELKAGFKKRSKTVPGYSPDFDRTTGAYMNWTSRHVSDQIHHDAIETAYDNIQNQHPSDATKTYWRDWRDYQDRPRDALSRAGDAASRLGYLYTLAGNISSAVVNATDPIVSSVPTLSVGNSYANAGKYFSKAVRHATAAMKADTSRGLYIEAQKAARTPEERDLIKRLENEGVLDPLWAQDMQALNDRHSALFGNLKSSARKMFDIASSTMGVTEEIKRTALALSAFRMAKDPKTLAAVDEAWSGNQVWRAMKASHGLTPETFARFMTSEGAFEWGRSNQAPVMRGPIGQATFLLHGFQTRFLSNVWNLMNNMGPDGKRALLWIALGVWVGSGIDGLPFAQDAQNAADEAWKFFTGKDPMIPYRLRSLMSDAGIGKVGAEIVMRGPASTVLGVDLASRIGFGDILTRQFSMDTFGGMPATIWSVIASRASAAKKKLESKQYGSAAAELLPSALRNVALAGIETGTGIKSQTGKVQIPKSKITATETVGRALGFTPQSLARQRMKTNYEYRARDAKRPPKNPVPRAFKDGGRVAVNETPTDAQLEAGNYKKHHMTVHGLPIAIETPRGVERCGIGADGKPWANTNNLAHYGYIKRTEGADGDHVDAYVGPLPKSEKVWVVDQIDPKSRKFDEHKVILGAKTLGHAMRIYDAGFSDGSGPKRRAHIRHMTIKAFKNWLKSGDTTAPIKKAA